MKRQWLSRWGFLILLLLFSLLLAGCWDYHELETLFIVMGVGLDQVADSDKEEGPDKEAGSEKGAGGEKMDVTLQIGKTQSPATGSSDTGTQKSSAILLKTAKDTTMESIMQLDQDSSRTMLLHHNQVMLLGRDLAKSGIENRIDAFLRNQQMRMEVLVMVADRRAEDILAAELEEEEISSMYLYGMMQDLYNVSPHYKIRMLDFVSRLRDGTSSAVAPIVELVEQEDKERLKLKGMAIFKKDKMVGSLSNQEMQGYIWTMGSVKQGALAAQTDLGRAVFRIVKLEAKRDISLNPNGSIRGTISVYATLALTELRGFSGMTPLELMPYLVTLSENEIKRQIRDAFKVAQGLDADIYRFGLDFHRRHPKVWKTIEEQWDRLFREMELDLQVKVKLPATGQIAKSLEMEEPKP
ncbi:MAG: Ger(x)C family spore germination protein [Clostridiales bacterium]